MDKKDYENDYYVGKFAGFLLTTTLFVALLFSWHSMGLDVKLAKYSMLMLVFVITMIILFCGKMVFHIPSFFYSC